MIITGDTHGTLDLDTLRTYCTNFDVREQYIVILGDVGVCFHNGLKDEIVRNALLDLNSKGILFIDGNHENFDLLNSYEVKEWNGGKVHFIEDNIIHLMRGQIFEIEGKKIFTFGGGNSIDKQWRIEGRSWWKEEMPSKEEYEEGLLNLEKVGNKVDYIFTHTAPREICKRMVKKMYSGEEELQDYLQGISETVDFKKWYYGHWHFDVDIDKKYIGMYNRVKKEG